MVVVGAGATLVPASMAATLPAVVHAVAVLELPVKARVFALWHPARATPAAGAFLRVLVEVGTGALPHAPFSSPDPGVAAGAAR